MYQRARTVGYKQLSGGALGTRSSKDIRRQWADLERKRRGHSMPTEDKPYDIPSYFSEKDRRRGKQHPGHMLLEERAYGPIQRGPTLRREHGQISRMGQLGSRKRGMTARERSEYERAIAEPVEEYLAEARGPRHTRRWLGDFSDPAALRARRRQQREVDLTEAQGAQQQALIEGPSVPETIEAAPAVRGKARPKWTATGERQYFTRKEYDAAHRMVPYEERQVAETGAYGPQRAARQPIAKRKLKFTPHESAAGPRVTGLDRAIVPAGLSYEERERQGAEMVPYRAPIVAKIPPVKASVAPAFVAPPPDVMGEPSDWRPGDTPATMDARAMMTTRRSEKRFEKRQAQESKDLVQERRIAQIGGKRGAEDVDLAIEESAQRAYDPRALFEPEFKPKRAPAGSRALFEPKTRPVRRKHAMSGLLGNERPGRPRSLSPGKKAQKRERERFALQPSTGVQVAAPEQQQPKVVKGTMIQPAAVVQSGLSPTQAREEAEQKAPDPSGQAPLERPVPPVFAAEVPAITPFEEAKPISPAQVIFKQPAEEPAPIDDTPAELSSVLRAAKRKAREERRAAIKPAIIMPDIPGVRGAEADATPAQVLEPGKRGAEELEDEEYTKFQVQEDPLAAGMPLGHEYFGRETEAEAAHPGRVKMWGEKAKVPDVRTGQAGQSGYHDIGSGGTRVHGYMPTGTRPSPFVTRDYNGTWEPTGSEDATKWSEHALKNERMRQKAAQANMQAAPAMPAEAAHTEMPDLPASPHHEPMPGMSDPFHFAGSGADHGNIDLSGLKFNMGANQRPEANSFMDAVNAGIGHMPAHEAEILTNNAAQASQHVGAMPANDFHAGLMGDFSSMFAALPGAAPDVAPEIAALPTMPHEESLPQVETGPDYIAETQGDKRPAADVAPASFKHAIDDPALETTAPFPPHVPEAGPQAVPEPAVQPPRPVTPELPPVVAEPEPDRTLQSAEAGAAAPHPAEPSHRLESRRKSVSFRVPKPAVAQPEPQKPYRRIVADYGARPGGPVGTQSVNVSAPSTSSAPVSSGQASGQASSAGSTAALREIAKAVAAKAKPSKARKSGISGARKRYTDARKTKLAALRAHRDKLVREHKSSTKKLPKKERDAARREFRKKVDGQYKEQVKKYPPARGMNDVGAVLKLIKRVQSARFS